MRSLFVLLLTFLPIITTADWIEDFTTFNEDEYHNGCWPGWIESQGVYQMSDNIEGGGGRFIQLLEHNLSSFEVQFDFMISGLADGINFVWSEDAWVGDFPGECIYWCNGIGYALELDIFYNSPHDPTTSDHIALLENGTLNPVAWSAQPSISNGQWHRINLVNLEGSVAVYYDNDLIIEHVFADYIGGVGNFRFSASGGSLHADQFIDNIQVTAALPVSTTASSWSMVKSLY